MGGFGNWQFYKWTGDLRNLPGVRRDPKISPCRRYPSSANINVYARGNIAHCWKHGFLYVFGDNIEDRFGHIKYLTIYILWGFFAALVHSIYAVAVGGGDIPAVGASGA